MNMIANDCVADDWSVTTADEQTGTGLFAALDIAHLAMIDKILLERGVCFQSVWVDGVDRQVRKRIAKRRCTKVKPNITSFESYIIPIFSWNKIYKRKQ